MTGTWPSASLLQQSHPKQTVGDLASALGLLTTRREWSELRPRAGRPFESRVPALSPAAHQMWLALSTLIAAPQPGQVPNAGDAISSTSPHCGQPLRAGMSVPPIRCGHTGKSCIARSDMTVIRTSCPSLNYSFCPRRLPCGTAPCRGEVKPWCCLHPNGLPAHQASLKNRPMH